MSGALKATSHYLNQCWPRYLTPNGVSRLQCFNAKQAYHRFYCSTKKCPPGHENKLKTLFPDGKTHHGFQSIHSSVNTMRSRQDGRHFSDDIFICIFLNKNEWHSIKISLKFVPKVPINNIPALIQIMAWRLPGDKPLSEPMMVVLLVHICVTRPQWVKQQLPWSHIKPKHVEDNRNFWWF